MFYKNATFFKLTGGTTINPEMLEAALGQFKIRPIGDLEMKVMGWHSTIGDILCHVSQGYATIKLATETRILPKEVVNKEVDIKVAEIEQTTGEMVSKRSRKDIETAVIQRLLPTTYTKWDYVWGTISPDGLVIVNSGSDPKVEMFLAMLRKSIGSLPVVPITRSSISKQLTDMVDEPLEPFKVLEEAQLNMSDGEEIKLKHVDISNDEKVRGYIDEDGYLVTKLGVEWDETLSCVLGDDCSVKRIKFSDIVTEQNDDIPKDQVLAKFDAGICLNNLELNRLGLNLINEFGENDEN